MLKETGLRLPQNRVFLEFLEQQHRWLYLYFGWDSAWHLSIIKKGYSFSNQSYAFFPGLTVFGSLFDLVFKNQMLSLWVISSLSGIFWVPIYQIVAEKYMNKREAIISTLLFAFFPYVFLFTTVIYTESLFLFFILLTWHYFENHKNDKTILFASISTLIRPVGFLIVIPIILYNILEAKNNRFILILKSLFPLITLFGWFFYSRIKSGDWFASIHTSEWNEMYNLYTWITSIIPKFGTRSLYFPIPWLIQHPLSPFFIFFFMIITPFLLYKLFKTHWYAGIYSIIYSACIMSIGTVVSYPRFLSFLFPIWMFGSYKFLQNRTSTLLSLVIISLFYIISIILWKNFLLGVFIA
jgi:Gpi18-like mannosyltransferase